ncbi:MAG: hypothetical protein M8349_01125 [ANME-2 cluster archaeon]|nr:hypothetical protein [ANME-2 cluster archaeon]MDF1556643.1 hypothetical protein [ANME-2 cluster archaeon]
MKIVREYQRREFCKDWGCPSQKKIDEAVDQSAVDIIREQDCKECMAHVFHTWLTNKDYQIVVIE